MLDESRYRVMWSVLALCLGQVVASAQVAIPPEYRNLSARELAGRGVAREIWIAKLREETGMYSADEDVLLEANGFAFERDPEKAQEYTDALNDALKGPKPRQEVALPEQQSVVSGMIEEPSVKEPAEQASRFSSIVGGTTLLVGLLFYASAFLATFTGLGKLDIFSLALEWLTGV